ncbi:MAG: flagellar export protein FliJ [Bdellovibrionales bacterium]|nr:flagellar export protein FliJ [Bdellovibrionales bacterium]
MKFKFPLQKVLDHRKTKENLAQKDFQIAMNDLVELESQLQRLEEALHGSHQRAGLLHGQGGAQGPALSQINEFQRGQKVLIQRQHGKIEEQKKVVEEKRELLKQAAVETKIISKFKEKKLTEFREAEEKEEQKQMDEQSILRYRSPERREG